MNASSEEAPRRYAIVESDRFDADRDRAILSFNRSLGPDRAHEWSLGLTRAISDLMSFPGPLSWAIDEEASAFYGREVRRMLYYGPTRRRTGMPVRILFTLLAPAADAPDPNAEFAIFLLRLLHGPQALSSPDPDATET